jgi:hypothetical protein
MVTQERERERAGEGERGGGGGGGGPPPAARPPRVRRGVRGPVPLVSSATRLGTSTLRIGHKHAPHWAAHALRYQRPMPLGCAARPRASGIRGISGGISRYPRWLRPRAAGPARVRRTPSGGAASCIRIGRWRSKRGAFKSVFYISVFYISPAPLESGGRPPAGRRRASGLALAGRA